MKKTVVVAGTFMVGVTALVAGLGLAQKSSNMMGKWNGVTIQAKLIGGNLVRSALRPHRRLGKTDGCESANPL